MDGIRIGKELRKQNRRCKIIIATAIEERYKEAFEINAFRFATKPFQQVEIENILEAVFNSERGTEKIELYKDRHLYEIEQYKIEYIWTYDSCSEFFIKEKRYRKDISLRELEEILDTKLFFRIHRKIIVNMRYINEYNDGNVKMNRITFKVSRRKKNEFEKIYMEYDLEHS